MKLFFRRFRLRSSVSSKFSFRSRRSNEYVCSSHSAGVGRTGVFITLSIVLERMRYEGVVDIFQTVKTLRTQRPAMVQTEVPTTRRRVKSFTHEAVRQSEVVM